MTSKSTVADDCQIVSKSAELCQDLDHKAVLFVAPKDVSDVRAYTGEYLIVIKLSRIM